MNDYKKAVQGAGKGKKGAAQRFDLDQNDEYREVKEKTLKNDAEIQRLQQSVDNVQADYNKAIADVQSKQETIDELKRQLSQKPDIQLLGRDNIGKGDKDSIEKVLELNRAVVGLNHRISELRIEVENRDRQIALLKVKADLVT